MSKYPWRTWAAQIAAILRLEVKKSFASRRAIAIYLLAGMQLFIVVAHAIAYVMGKTHCSGSEDMMIFAGVFQLFYLRGVVFFGCVVMFLNLFRGDLLDKTLHYYFLSPVRREVLAIGKYLSGVVTTVAVFGATTVVSYLIMCRHMGMTRNGAALVSTALGNTGAYLGVTVLACIGYGSVFLILGMLFRNPIVPAITVLVWESFIVFYPPVLKKISVIFYLESLCPVHVPFDGDVGKLFAFPSDPPPAFVAVFGLLLLSAAIVTLAAIRIRRLDINYGSD